MSSLPLIPLSYTVVLSTPHSGNYGPEHILLDKPSDQASRWSGAYQGNDAKQWILLKLDQMSVLKTIAFGKFSKPHPCNMKDFKVYVGITEENLVEVLHGGLKNDTTTETFPIRHVNNAQVFFPTRYVKVVPLSAHGQNFHTSIWHVALNGISDKKYVDHIYRIHEEHRESTVLRHVLKHLRQRRLLTPYQDILSRAFTNVEHPLITQLHATLVLRGAFKEAEKHLQTLTSSGLFSSYLQSSHPYAVWDKLVSPTGDDEIPSPRSGHAMCIDPLHEFIYLHGGYDGEKCLDDFWAYSIKGEKWHRLMDSTHNRNGPSARSCHKMALDCTTGIIYVLGRLTDADAARAPLPRQGPPSTTSAGSQSSHRSSSLPPLPSHPSPPTSETSSSNTYCSDFYLYHTRGEDKGVWKYISFDVASSGGPPLVFDHQMVVDSEAQALYVFGGRVLDGDWDTYKYAGLYAYNLKSSRWKLLQSADNSPTAIPPRYGHSMVLDPNTRILHIFGGQRGEKYLSDMYTYNLNTSTVTELFSNFTLEGGPSACFTQRAVIDPDLKEVYVFCGLVTDESGMTGYLPGDLYNWVYRYNTRPGTWTHIQPEADRPKPKPRSIPKKVEEPRPRYAHDVVYHPKTKRVYLFGGNANLAGPKDEDSMVEDACDGIQKMSDFWKMEVYRPGSEEIIRKATYHIRRQQFREMCEESTPSEALRFLKSQVSPVVNHDDQKETEDYRSLTTFLLAPKPSPLPVIPSLLPTSAFTSNNPSPLSDRSSESIKDDWSTGSRGSTPSDGTWSSEMVEVSDDDTELSSRVSYPRLSADLLRAVQDPTEKREGGKGKAMSAERYAQRTEVFESLLEFVNEWDKEPSGSLLDFVTRNDSREDDNV